MHDALRLVCLESCCSSITSVSECGLLSCWVHVRRYPSTSVNSYYQEMTVRYKRKGVCCYPTNHRIWRKVLLLPTQQKEGFLLLPNQSWHLKGFCCCTTRPLSTPLEGFLLLSNQLDLRYASPPNKILGVELRCDSPRYTTPSNRKRKE
jgi:hypothetical protein